MKYVISNGLTPSRGNGCRPAQLVYRANDYSSNDKNIDTPWVALLLSKVSTGNEWVIRQDNTALTAPPQGYDSVSVSGMHVVPDKVVSCLDSSQVIEEVKGRLNYDELVVYTYDAIRPTWLVMFQRK
jgi:hypothetical protein